MSWTLGLLACASLLFPSFSTAGTTSGKELSCRVSDLRPREPCVPMVEMEVRDVVPVNEADAHAVMLISKADGTLLPVLVEEGDALSIAFRLAHRAPPRALPHELLEKVIKELGGTVTEVRLDSQRGHNYAGWVFIVQGDRRLELEGHPAELISLALARGTKIYASRKLLSEAGISRQEVDRLKKQDSRPGVGGSGPGPTCHSKNSAEGNIEL